MMNPSVNHDVKGVMAGISNGDVSLELARRKIAWLDLLPFPMHVDADAKDCLNFIRKQDMGMYVRLISAMARLHHAFFDALGGLDNVCVIAQSSIVGRSKYKNVFRHFFAEVEEHCDSNLSFGPIERFGFKAHASSFLTGRYPGLEGVERTDAEIAYAYAFVFGEWAKLNTGASAVAKNGDGWAATQANRSVQGKKQGKKHRDNGTGMFKPVPDPENPGVMTNHSSLIGRKSRDENTGIFKPVPDPENPGVMTTHSSLIGRKSRDENTGIFKPVPDPENPGVMTTHSSLIGRKSRDENTGIFDPDRLLDRSKARSKTIAAKRDEVDRVVIVEGTVCPGCNTALERDCNASVWVQAIAGHPPALNVTFGCPCKVKGKGKGKGKGKSCGQRSILDAHVRAEMYQRSNLSDPQKSEMEDSITAWMVREVGHFNAAGQAAADDAGKDFRRCVISERALNDKGPKGASAGTLRNKKYLARKKLKQKQTAEESGGG